MTGHQGVNTMVGYFPVLTLCAIFASYALCCLPRQCYMTVSLSNVCTLCVFVCVSVFVSLALCLYECLVN